MNNLKIKEQLDNNKKLLLSDIVKKNLREIIYSYFEENEKLLYNNYVHCSYKHYEKNEKYLNYYYFTVVRNPYHRLISFFYNHVSMKKYDINTWIEKFMRIQYTIQPQFNFLSDKEGNIKIDKILRYENLDKEIRKFFLDKFNIKLGNIPRINSSKAKVNYDSKIFTKKSLEIINEFYKKDFETFDYEIILPT